MAGAIKVLTVTSSETAVTCNGAGGEGPTAVHICLVVMLRSEVVAE